MARAGKPSKPGATVFRTATGCCGRKRCVNSLPQDCRQAIPASEGQRVGQERPIDRLAEDYAAAKAESQRIWQLLQAELRAGTPASELTDLEGRMWAAMHRLERASAGTLRAPCRRPANTRSGKSAAVRIKLRGMPQTIRVDVSPADHVTALLYPASRRQRDRPHVDPWSRCRREPEQRFHGQLRWRTRGARHRHRHLQFPLHRTSADDCPTATTPWKPATDR